MRPFPMQGGPPIPWFLAVAIYDHLYRYGGQTLERLAERGGFGWAEVEHLWKDFPRTSNAHRHACVEAVRVALDQEDRDAD